MEPLAPIDDLQHSQIRLYNDLCTKYGAINLAQGLFLVERRTEKTLAIKESQRALEDDTKNTYAHFSGIPDFRNVVVELGRAYNGFTQLDARTAHKQVLTTAGALFGSHCAYEAFLKNQDDEALLFQPFYSYHRDQLKSKGRHFRAVTLHPPNWSFSTADLEAAWSENVKLLVLNTPANPCGKVFTFDELSLIADFCIRHEIIVIADEVYQFMIFDGREHVSIATLPGMWERTVTLASVGKLLASTGWRLGYAVGPEKLIDDMALVNEFTSACANVPAQHGAVKGLQRLDLLLEHRAFYQRKRDIICEGLRNACIKHWVPQGGGYVLADVSELMAACKVTSSVDIVKRLIVYPGVGGVPATDFYSSDAGQWQMRVSIGVTDEVAQEAAARLSTLRIDRLEQTAAAA
jgi:aminotransferase